MGELSPFNFFKFRSWALFVSGFVLCAATKSQLDPVCEENHTMTPFPPPEIWKRHVVLFSIHVGTANTKISQCFDVNLRTVQRILKELDQSSGDYKNRAARKPDDRFDKKRTPEVFW